MKLLEDIYNKADESSSLAVKILFQKRAGIEMENEKTYFAIQIFFEVSTDELLLEHEQYHRFKKSTDLYYKHPENSNIPVLAHYHIVDNKSKKEIYAVNVDGSAHHRKNKGFEIPQKQANELRTLGVAIPHNNIIESVLSKDNFDKTDDIYSFLIVLTTSAGL